MEPQSKEMKNEDQQRRDEKSWRVTHQATLGIK
jgi:hypothetical protein